MESNFTFDGLRVTAFESRRAKEIEKLISYHGGIPRIAPSMREIPIAEPKEAFKFAQELFDNRYDVLILMTGVGTRALAKALKTKYPLDELVAAIKEVTTVARGPKPARALRELGLKPDVIVPEPNTWREILKTLDDNLDVKGKSVAVQEYGVSNGEFLEELSKRGASVKAVPIYRWGLPEDIVPLKKAIYSIIDNGEDVLLFTSSQQIRHLLQVADREGLLEELKKGLKQTILASIGPATTETLKGFGLSADYEPDSPKMGNLIRETARRGNNLLKRKKIAYENGVNTNGWNRIEMVWDHRSEETRKEITQNSIFMKACRKEKTDYTPIWLMRQAGRFMREYRELRGKISFMELCKTPELEAEVTISAVDRLGVDAAIIFSDILLIVESLGIDLEFSNGEGPRIKRPVRSAKAVARLTDFDPESLKFVYDGIKITRRALDPQIALIGFAGAPFTVASYVIEGRGSRNYENAKGLMYRDPKAWNDLMQKLTHATQLYLNRQIESGADAIQLFDSWVGCLSPHDYKEFVLPHVKTLIDGIKDDVPVILFGTGTSSLLELIKESESHVIGLDWRVDIDKAWELLGSKVAVQGNLDPVTLFANPEEIKKRARFILDKVDGRPGHIFNLGHGVLPRTPVDNVLALIDFVHAYSDRKHIL